MRNTLWNMEAIVRLVVGWLKNIAKSARRKHIRYFRLTPGLSFIPYGYFFDIVRFKVEKIEIRNRIDSLVADHVLVDASYDFKSLSRNEDISARYRSIVESGKQPLIIDCGGNIGLSTLWFLREFPCAHVVCIEPDSENVEIAKRHIANGDAVVLHAAVGASDGFCQIANPEANQWGYQVKKSGCGDVKLLSIPTILQDFPEDSFEPFVIKIDIEGFEQDLFSTNTDWIDEFYILTIELHDWVRPNSATSHNFLRAISAYKRDFVLSGENIFSIRLQVATLI